MSLTKSNTRMLEGEDLTLTGSLGIGTSSPAAPLEVSTSGAGYRIQLTHASGQNKIKSLDGNQSTFRNLLFDAEAHMFETSGAERMRILSDGSIAIGDIASTRHSKVTKALIFNGSSDGGQFALHVGRGGTGTESQICFSNGNGQVGGVTTSGASTSFNTSSDYRLKENVVDITDGITRVKQLEPKKFNFIADAGTTVDGFIAHEAQAVVPEAVHGTKDEVDDEGNPVMQGIDQAKLVPLLTAALKEAIAKIEVLETKVEALENA